MELKEHHIPAQIEKQSWVGTARFSLSGASYLKIESPGAEHLNFEVPDGITCDVEIDVRIVKVYNS